jgi:hypothetical protein
MAEQQNPNSVGTNPAKTKAIPATDVDFGNIIKLISTKWAASPWLTLVYLTSAQFTVKATAFQTTLAARQQSGSTRSQTTKALKTLDKSIDNGLVYIKNYLLDKYKKESYKSYYAAFGILSNGQYPKDQNSRSAAVKLTIDAIAANGFGTKEFGTAFWTGIKTQYDALLTTASTTDSTVSTKVGDKNALKAELKKALNSIIFVIKGNYPDTYKQELRNWGFQKEKY